MTPASRAIGATSDALATCTHAASDAGVPTTASQAARWVAVASAAKAVVWRIGMVRSGRADRDGADFCGPQAGRTSAWALWVSARAATAAHLRANLPFRAPRWAPTGDG